MNDSQTSFDELELKHGTLGDSTLKIDHNVTVINF